MATTNTTSAQNNSFILTGFVAVDATVKNFDKTDVARFPLSLVRKETQGEATVRKSALINCETWAKKGEANCFDLLKKGQLVAIKGYIKPEEWTDAQGVKQSRITFVCQSVEKTAPQKAEPKAEKSVPKGKKAKAA